MKFNWFIQSSRYLEVEGFINNDKVSELRVSISEDKTKATVVWIHVLKEYQGHGYAIELLKEFKKNIKNYVNSIEVVKFYQVTSLGVMRLIRKVFEDAAELDFSHLYYLDIDRENEVKEDFINMPWIPEKSPARYVNGSCTISKGEPGVTLKVLLNKEVLKHG